MKRGIEQEPQFRWATKSIKGALYLCGLIIVQVVWLNRRKYKNNLQRNGLSINEDYIPKEQADFSKYVKCEVRGYTIKF